MYGRLFTLSASREGYAALLLFSAHLYANPRKKSVLTAFQAKQKTTCFRAPHIDVANLRIAEQLLRGAFLRTIAHANLFYQRAVVAVSLKSQKPAAIFFRNDIAFRMTGVLRRMDINRTRKRRLPQFPERVVGKQQQFFFIFTNQLQAMPARCASCRHLAMRRETIIGGFPGIPDPLGNLTGNRHDSIRTHNSPRCFFLRGKLSEITSRASIRYLPSNSECDNCSFRPRA